MKRLQNKLIFTRIGERSVTASFENGRCVQLECDTEEPSLLGNLYIGKVKNIVSNIDAAFVEIIPGMICYLPLEEARNPVYTSKIPSKHLVAQDELLVQVKKEGIKTKAPGLTTDFSLTGQYLVLTHGNTRMGLSSKLEPAEKKRLKEWMEPFANTSYGWIIRTNAAQAAKELVLAEAQNLARQYERIIETARFRTCYSLLMKSESSCIKTLKNRYHTKTEEIVTDQRDLYDEIMQYEQCQPAEQRSAVTLYEDPLLPLSKLYSLERELEEALKERVWMKSGAYLVIQSTEALNVIDVNTGKCAAKKGQQETFLKINKEAAAEIARQLRLRNISGIIVVDFINLEQESARLELLRYFEELLNRDPIKTTLVDMTRLGLVEITRKKVKKSLFEQVRQKDEKFAKKSVDAKQII